MTTLLAIGSGNGIVRIKLLSQLNGKIKLGAKNSDVNSISHIFCNISIINKSITKKQQILVYQPLYAHVNPNMSCEFAASVWLYNLLTD